MTTETTSPSGWDRAAMLARWCRDKAAGFITSFWLYVILWSVVAIAFTVLLYIDGKFSRGLAEGLEDIDPFSFQAMGWGFRLFAAVFLMAAARCIYKDVKGALTFRMLGVFASVIVCLHAFGFGFQALQDRRDDAMAVREVVALQASNSAEQIALLREQIETTRADRDAQVNRLQASIDGIVSDGLNNDQLADVYRADQTQAEADAKAKIDAAEREISRLAAEGNTAQQNIATVTADEKPWPALYIGMAQLLTWSKEPDDWAIYLCGVGFIILWVLLAEALVIFLPERIYLMHLRDADRPDIHESISADVPDGKVRVEMTAEEWTDYERAMEVHRSIKAGAKKGATTKRRGNKIEAADGYYRDKIAGWMVAHNEGVPTVTIANGSGMTVAQMRTTYGPHMTPEEHDALFFSGAFAEPAPEPEAEEPEPVVAVADSPQADEADEELEIPPEPQEWPMAPYTPPANDDPENKDAA